MRATADPDGKNTEDRGLAQSRDVHKSGTGHRSQARGTWHWPQYRSSIGRCTAARLLRQARGVGAEVIFVVSLPLGEPVRGEPAAAESVSPQVEIRGKVRALIVDDNIDAAASLGLLLDLRGHTTYIVHNGGRL